MLRIQPPVIVIPTREVESTLGSSLKLAGQAAFREIAVAAKGLEIDFLQFVFGGRTLAVCSRVRRSGVVEIELGFGDKSLPSSIFTTKQARLARAAVLRSWRRD